MEQIDKMQAEITEIRTQARLFSSKECAHCKDKLALPTIHFMCGHTFHDQCVESEGVRRCPKCQPEFQEVKDLRDQLMVQARQTTEPFINELKES